MMQRKVYEYQIPWERLQLNTEDLYLSMGASYVPDGEMLQVMATLKEEIALICRPRYLYAVFDATIGDCKYVGLDGISLQTGSVITPYLEQADQYVLFVATAGMEFDSFQHREKEKGDVFREFLIDAYGSAIAEATVRELCQDIEADAQLFGQRISHPYSPGYCGWTVAQQQTLFSLLPEYPCGVQLSSSSLMVPIKSVSGVIAVGCRVTKRKYGCELCGKKDCYKNRNK